MPQWTIKSVNVKKNVKVTVRVFNNIRNVYKNERIKTLSHTGV